MMASYLLVQKDDELKQILHSNTVGMFTDKPYMHVLHSKHGWFMLILGLEQI